MSDNKEFITLTCEKDNGFVLAVRLSEIASVSCLGDIYKLSIVYRNSSVTTDVNFDTKEGMEAAISAIVEALTKGEQT